LSKLDDLLAQLEDGEAAEAIKAELLSAQTRAAKAERDLKITKPELREKFPRAMAAYDKGRVTLPDNPSDDALFEYLKNKEEEYADLGVPIPGVQNPVVEPTDDYDPADSFGSPVAGGAPAPKRDYVREVVEAIKTNTSDGREKAAQLLTELNVQEGFQSPKIEEITRRLNAKPIRL